MFSIHAHVHAKVDRLKAVGVPVGHEFIDFDEPPAIELDGCVLQTKPAAVGSPADGHQGPIKTALLFLTVLLEVDLHRAIFLAETVNLYVDENIGKYLDKEKRDDIW